MQLSDLHCAECSLSFTLASSLLKHFAQHAVQITPNCENDAKVKRPNKLIPDLYPISTLKAKKSTEAPVEESEENVDSGIEDLVNPLAFYLIHMENASTETSDSDKPKNKFFRKYKCLYCSKMFGWSTDLKRHTLIHTGERPFKCTVCNSTFTRKFLLQKHQSKQHCDKDNHIQSALTSKLPPLKPIFFKRKARKQDKQKIKRKMCNESTS